MAHLAFRKSLIFGICRYRIITNSNESEFSRKANVQILSTSNQFPQLVCLQNSTIITSAKTCHGVTTQGHMASVSSSGDCIHCKTNNQSLESFSEKFRKIVIFGFFSKIPKNTSFRKIPVLQYTFQKFGGPENLKQLWSSFFFFKYLNVIGIGTVRTSMQAPNMCASKVKYYISTISPVVFKMMSLGVNS